MCFNTLQYFLAKAGLYELILFFNKTSRTLMHNLEVLKHPIY